MSDVWLNICPTGDMPKEGDILWSRSVHCGWSIINDDGDLIKTGQYYGNSTGNVKIYKSKSSAKSALKKSNYVRKAGGKGKVVPIYYPLREIEAKAPMDIKMLEHKL